MFEPEPFVEGLKSEWHRFVPSLTERDNYLDAVRQTEIVKTGAAVAEWACARVFPVGDPLDAIAEVISRLHGAGGADSRVVHFGPAPSPGGADSRHGFASLANDGRCCTDSPEDTGLAPTVLLTSSVPMISRRGYGVGEQH
jgi:hypothetical protein